MSAPSTKLHADFGLIVEKLTPELARQLECQTEKGVAVEAVVAHSVADSAGLRPGDLIEAVNRIAIRSPDDFRHAERMTKKGEGVPVLVQRGPRTFLTGFQLQPDTSEEDDLSSAFH
jgi:serine protease Do